MRYRTALLGVLVGLSTVVAAEVKGLGRLPDNEWKEVYKKFRKGMRAKDYAERRLAIMKLGDVDDYRVISELKRVTQGRYHYGLRALAARALGRIEDPRALEALLLCARSGLPSTVLPAVLEALGNFKDPKAVPVLKKNIRSANARVSASAIEALGKIKPRDLVIDIIQIFAKYDAQLKRGKISEKRRDEYSTIRLSAHTALKEITGQYFETPTEYLKWWKENAKNFAPHGGLKPKKEGNPRKKKKKQVQKQTGIQPSDEIKVAKAEPKPARVVWLQSLDEALTRAKETKKPIMIDFYAEWCGWCKKLDKEVYAEARIIALSADFFCVKIDAEKNAEIASRFGVRGYPTIVFLNPAGKEVAKIIGYRPVSDFLKSMLEARDKAK